MTLGMNRPNAHRPQSHTVPTAAGAERVKPGVVTPWVMTLGRVAGQVPDRADTRGRPGVLNQWPTDDLIGLKALRESQLPVKSSLSLLFSCHSYEKI
jgi:hypothetical protein